MRSLATFRLAHNLEHATNKTTAKIGERDEENVGTIDRVAREDFEQKKRDLKA